MVAVNKPIDLCLWLQGRAEAAADPAVQEHAVVHEQAPMNKKDLWLDAC